MVVEEAMASLIKSKRRLAIALNGQRQVIAQLERNALLQRATLLRTNHGMLSRVSLRRNPLLLKAQKEVEKQMAKLPLNGLLARNAEVDRKVEEREVETARLLLEIVPLALVAPIKAGGKDCLLYTSDAADE